MKVQRNDSPLFWQIRFFDLRDSYQGLSKVFLKDTHDRVT